MTEFEFKGDWFTQFELPMIASQLDNPKYSFRRSDLGKNEYALEIRDAFDTVPTPFKEQLETIHFIQNANNQRKIIDNLYNYIKDIVYPEYQQIISEEEYPGTFPSLEKLTDLYSVIGLDHVIIHRFGQEGSVYYCLMCECSIDEEHGLGFVLYEDQIIEHGDIGGLSYEKVAQHMKLSYKEYLDFQSKIQTHPTKEYQSPSNRFGSLKPWQLDVNRSYHFHLFRNNENQKLIEFLESGNISLDKAFANLRNLLQRDPRKILMDYFRSKGYK